MLVHDALYRSLEAMHRVGIEAKTDAEGKISAASPAPCRKVEGAERIASTVMIDQSLIGRTPRSNPVTYIKAFDPRIRGGNQKDRREGDCGVCV